MAVYDSSSEEFVEIVSYALAFTLLEAVDVKFAASSRTEELPADKIVQISRPYLEWSIAG